jgi:hypothetical protein
MMGKFFITGAYGAVYIFSAEQFPTVIRNIGIGAGSTFARVGGIFASYTSVLVRLLTCLLTFQRFWEKGQCNEKR